LSHIEFVVVVVFHAVLKETIYQLTNLGDRGALSQVGKIIELFREWVEKYVDKEVNNTSLSHKLLPFPIGDALTSERIIRLGFSSEENH
jgi:DNA-binding HxlR family transcriptional regulator